MPIKCKGIGDIHVNVYKTPEGSTFFYVEASNQDVLPVRYVIEDTLVSY